MMKTLWALAAVLVLGACSGGNGSGTPGDVGEDTAADVATPDSRTDAAEPDQVPDTGIPCSQNLVLEFFGIEDGMGLETGANLMVQARIYDAVMAVPVAGLEVVFELTGDGDAALAATKAVTNDQGVAAIELLTGSKQGAEYNLSVSNPCTGKVGIGLHTVAPESGTVLVHFVLSPELSALFPAVSLEVYSSFVLKLCAAVDYNAPGGVSVKLPDGVLDVELPEVKANVANVVFGVASSPDGKKVGGGCLDKVLVLPDKSVEITITIEPLALIPAGAYDLELSLDAAAALGDDWVDVGEALAEVVDAAPAAVGAKVIEDLEVWFPGGFPADCADAAEQIQALVDAGFAGADTTVADWIAGEAGPMLEALLADVRISGKAMVEPGDMPQAWDLLFTVEELAWSGKVSCRKAGCGAGTEATPDQFSLGDVTLGLGQHDLALYTEGFDGLVFPPTDLAFEPGRLHLFAFTHVVLSAAGLGPSVDELFGPMVDCGKIFSGMTPQLVACLNKPPSQLAESCDAALAAMKQTFYGKFGPQAGKQVVQVSGTGQSFDDDSDLTANRLEGTLEGTWTSDGVAAGSVMLELSALQK
ncbi:MAG: hypothetical protein FJ109_12655 [Deltaproteobacteria bacterium]|nr:hypothetical protein [Deltaproteobacteria bacterium]